MSDKSTIEWTDATWNPVTGCSHVSEGCRHCYAEALSLRFGRSKKPWTAQNASENVVLHHERLEMPLRWKAPRMVFVNSMSDLFHELVPTHFIDEVFETMDRSVHTFQILTKRPERMRRYMVERTTKLGALQPRVWCGASIEEDRWCRRADYVRESPAVVHFLSCEPLLGPLSSLNLDGIDWVICGGESGSKARPMEAQWARLLRDMCADRDVPFFFKQWGGRTPRSGGRILDGRTHDGFPQ